MSGRKVLVLEDLRKVYELGSGPVVALDGVSLSAAAGSFVSIMGPSGSGKSTLLHLAGGLDSPTSGSVVVDGQDLAQMSDDGLTRFRRRKMGFVFQFFNLLPTMNAWENVALPLVLEGKRLSQARPGALELLDRVGLAARASHRPGQLSGGEMQRVAIARALAADPLLILADEPTGNLDSHAGQAVLGLMRAMVDEDRRSVIMVTHDEKAASMADQIVRLNDGRLEQG